MKKTVFVLFFILFVSSASGEDVYHLKLRTSHHPEFIRIVIEGTEPIISKGTVNQKGKDILVSFPYAEFTVLKEDVSITFNQDKNILFFSPGDFNKYRVFTLKYPSRLVIDVFLIKEKEYPTILHKESVKGQVRMIKPVTTVIVDPGHGGYNSGITKENYSEKHVVLDIAKMLKALIQRRNIKCLLTRKSDQFIPLRDRISFANTNEAQVFLSLHIGNHSGIVLYTPFITESPPSPIRDFLVNKGQEDFIADTTSLSDTLYNVIAEDLGSDMVTIQPIPYSILSKIEAAALIIELPSFEEAHYIPAFKKEIANIIYKGLYLYEEGKAK